MVKVVINSYSNSYKSRVLKPGARLSLIEGTIGKAKVETIGAGVYNIQCFHFRTLIKEI